MFGYFSSYVHMFYFIVWPNKNKAMTTIIKKKSKTRKHIYTKCTEHILMTGAAYTLITVIFTQPFPFSAWALIQIFIFPHLDRNIPLPARLLACLLHDYEVKLYFAELVLLFKNLTDHNITFRLSRLADGAPCNCFCISLLWVLPTVRFDRTVPTRLPSLQTPVTGLAVRGLPSLQASWLQIRGSPQLFLGLDIH